jgi:hypothetical protein
MILMVVVRISLFGRMPVTRMVKKKNIQIDPPCCSREVSSIAIL